MIATVMSTIDSYGFIAAATVGRDLVWRIVRGDEDRVPRWTRYGLWIATAFAAALALLSPSVVALWHDLGSIVTPTLLLPVGTALLGRGRLGPRWTLAAMVAPFVLSLAWVLAAAFPRPGAPRRLPAVRRTHLRRAGRVAARLRGGLARPETEAIPDEARERSRRRSSSGLLLSPGAAARRRRAAREPGHAAPRRAACPRWW